MENLALNTNHPPENPPSLQPRIAPVVQEFLNNAAMAHMLSDGFGTPLNIMFPDSIDENIKSFKDAYKKNHMRGRIYFTSKPCKSESLVRRASLSDIGIDVSSPRSLNHVLACGFSPDRIEATGPKNMDYILSCLQLDVLLNVDSFAELISIRDLSKKLALSRKARIMIRLCGFQSKRMNFTPQDNTFGIPTKEIPAVIDWLVEHKDIINFQGFAFYISGATVEQRTVAIENQLELTFLARQKGLSPKGIDIGGGFAIQYSDSATEWNDYIESLKKSVLGKTESLTWNNGGLGFRDVNGVVAGAPLFINHGATRTKGEELDFWLNQRTATFGNTTLADTIRDSLLELYIEPGRGLLDQSGVTMGRVAFVKTSTWGETLVGLEMNQSNIHAIQHKLLTSPVHIPRDQSRNQKNTKGLYYMGNLCVSYDILQYNKSYPDLLPLPGDLIAFCNTAPYIMDFVESETLMQPLAKKVAVWKDSTSLRWAMDDKYSAIK